MENINRESKPLSLFIFFPLLFLVFIRPFFSGLTYPGLEIYYENLCILLSVATLISHAKKYTKNPYTLPILLLFSSYIISSIFSLNLNNSIKETVRFVSLMAIFFAVSQADKKQKKVIINFISIAVSIISLYAIYQYFWGYQRTIDYLKKINSDFLQTSSYARDILLAKRAIGTFPSPTIFGGYLITVFFLIFQGSTLKSLKSRLNLAVSLLLISFALLFTKSMGAWLSLIFALAIFFYLSRKSLKQQKIIMITSLVLITLALSFILMTRWERLTNLENPQNSITQRLDYWRTSLAIIKDRYLFGVGPGNFQEVFLDYKIGLGTNTKYAHNIFLHQWVELGLLGLIGLFYLLVSFFRRFNANSESKFIYLSALAFIAHNLIDNTYFMPETGLFFWVLLGLSHEQSGP